MQSELKFSITFSFYGRQNFGIIFALIAFRYLPDANFHKTPLVCHVTSLFIDENRREGAIKRNRRGVGSEEKN